MQANHEGQHKQVSEMLEASSPEQLQALKAALQQLGAQLDAASGGGADPQVGALSEGIAALDSKR